MILHTLAHHRADYIGRRGVAAKFRREQNYAIDMRIAQLNQVRPQAVEAGNADDVFNIDAAIIDLNNRRHA